GTEIAHEVLGVSQLVLTAFLALTYFTFYVPLNVRKQFKLKINEKWEDKKRNLIFYKDYIKYMLKDRYLWFLVAYTIVSILGYFVHPSFYSIQLIEIIARSKTLQNVVTAVTSHAKTLIITGLLLLFTLYTYAALVFQFRSEEYFAGDINEYLCDTLAKCL